MPTIKDALAIIGKLTVAEQESLKTMLLSPVFVKSLNIEDFVAKERFANGRVCPPCGCIHVVRNGHRKDGTQRYVCTLELLHEVGRSFRSVVTVEDGAVCGGVGQAVTAFFNAHGYPVRVR